jgi:glycosyltransferase involved in cell wall biosynthesis
MVESLVREFRARGYEAELVTMPFKWYPANSLYDSALAWRMADLTESDGRRIDLVVACKFPSYAVKHPNKALWLTHQHRAAYDLFESREFGGLAHMPDGARIRARVERLDAVTLAEAEPRYTISKNVSTRLSTFCGIDSEPLYHPPKHVGRYRSEGYGRFVLSVGRLDALKRVDLLLRSLAFCSADVQAVVVGDGPQAEPLRRLAAKLRVADRVRFLGAVSDETLLELYATAGAVYFAPVDEDYGYVTLEAFLSHRPVVTCTDSGGVLEFAEHGRSALVGEPVPEAVGAQLESLMHDGKRCAAFGAAGYEKVKPIGWETVVDALTRSLR